MLCLPSKNTITFCRVAELSSLSNPMAAVWAKENGREWATMGDKMFQGAVTVVDTIELVIGCNQSDGKRMRRCCAAGNDDGNDDCQAFD